MNLKNSLLQQRALIEQQEMRRQKEQAEKERMRIENEKRREKEEEERFVNKEKKYRMCLYTLLIACFITTERVSSPNSNFLLHHSYNP